jgi:tryptophan synthase alpha chain
VAGVTGARTQIADNVFSDVANIKKRVTLPVAEGFGISNPEQAARIASVAEGVVVGSAIVKLFEDHHGEALASHLHDFVVSLKDGIAGTC